MKLTEAKLKQLIKEVVMEAKYSDRDSHNRYVDAESHIGQKMFFHTDRTTRKAVKNGMIGTYEITSTGSPSKTSWKTNAVIIDDATFYVAESAAQRTAATGHRTVHAGVVGTVSKDNASEEWTLSPDEKKGPWKMQDLSHKPNFSKGDSEIEYRPDVGFFYLKGQPKKRINKADKVYFQATEANNYVITAINPS